MDWAAVVGSFTCTLSGETRQWWWSDEVYRICGWDPSSGVPDEDRISDLEHPEERGALVAAVTGCGTTGGAFALPARLQTDNGVQRWVTWTGERTAAGDDGSSTVTGRLVDASEHWQRLVSEQTQSHLQAALASRETIDLAKGALMLAYGLDDQAAFELLVWCSQRSNIKLLELAERFRSALVRGGGLALEVRTNLEHVVFPLGAQQARHPGASRVDGAAEGTAPAPRGPARDGNPVTVESRVTPRGLLVKVGGHIDLAAAPALAAALTERLERATAGQPVRLDLGDVVHCGPAGRSVLDTVVRRARAAGLLLEVEGPAHLGTERWQPETLRDDDDAPAPADAP